MPGLTIDQMRRKFNEAEQAMPFTPAPNPDANTSTKIDATLTTVGTAQDLVTVPVGQIGRKLSIINRGPGDAAIAFDATATSADVLLKDGESYSEDGIAIATKVSYINVTAGKKPRITGILWSS